MSISEFAISEQPISGNAEAASGSLNISATTDALTLAEHSATIGKSLNISATTDALTLAEHAATISLSINVQATTDALTLTEYAATLGATHNVEATTDALTLAEYPATLSFALNVQASTDALELLEYPATISALAESTGPNPGLSAWTEYGQTEASDVRRERVRRERERLGIVEPTAPKPVEPVESATPEQDESTETTAPPAAVRSGSATPRVVSLDAFKALREAEALAREALDAEAKAYSLARAREIQRRVALLLLASEA